MVTVISESYVRSLTGYVYKKNSDFKQNPKVNCYRHGEKVNRMYRGMVCMNFETKTQSVQLTCPRIKRNYVHREMSYTLTALSNNITSKYF